MPGCVGRKASYPFIFIIFQGKLVCLAHWCWEDRLNKLLLLCGPVRVLYSIFGFARSVYFEFCREICQPSSVCRHNANVLWWSSFSRLPTTRCFVGNEDKPRLDLSHPVHGDNCLLHEDGSCIKMAPAYTWRDYSAILYLNEDFEGGQFIMTDDTARRVKVRGSFASSSVARRHPLSSDDPPHRARCWTRGCGAGTQIPGSGFSSRHLKFFWPEFLLQDLNVFDFGSRMIWSIENWKPFHYLYNSLALCQLGLWHWDSNSRLQLHHLKLLGSGSKHVKLLGLQIHGTWWTKPFRQNVSAQLTFACRLCKAGLTRRKSNKMRKMDLNICILSLKFVDNFASVLTVCFSVYQQWVYLTDIQTSFPLLLPSRFDFWSFFFVQTTTCLWWCCSAVQKRLLPKSAANVLQT